MFTLWRVSNMNYVCDFFSLGSNNCTVNSTIY